MSGEREIHNHKSSAPLQVTSGHVVQRLQRCLRPLTSVGLGFLALSAIGLTLPTANVMAAGGDSITVKVRVESPREPARAIGLIVSSHGAKQISDTIVQKVTDKLFDIVFPVDRKLLDDNSVATAMAISAGGDITFANMTPTLLSNQRAGVTSVPECPPIDPTLTVMTNKFGTYQQLVQIREQRAKLARERVRLLLDGDLLEKLQRAEEAFGLIHAEELSVNLPPQELADRLARISYALKEYQSTNHSQSKESSDAE